MRKEDPRVPRKVVVGEYSTSFQVTGKEWKLSFARGKEAKGEYKMVSPITDPKLAKVVHSLYGGLSAVSGENLGAFPGLVHALVNEFRRLQGAGRTDIDLQN